MCQQKNEMLSGDAEGVSNGFSTLRALLWSRSMVDRLFCTFFLLCFASRCCVRSPVLHALLAVAGTAPSSTHGREAGPMEGCSLVAFP